MSSKVLFGLTSNCSDTDYMYLELNAFAMMDTFLYDARSGTMS